MRKINWGIIGLGNIAKKFADAFSVVDNATVKGVASLNQNKLRSFKKRFNIDEEFCFNRYEDLILSPSIDIVYIALPNSLHVKYVRDSINNKKNVLVEKPAFINPEDLMLVKNLVKKEKIFFTEAFMYRYLPYFQKVREIIDNESLGKVVDINSTFNLKVYKQKNFFGIKFMKPDYSHRLFNKKLGGGAILDIGCYPLSLSTFINSITYNVELNDISLENVHTDYCDKEVDIFSKLTLNFNNKFKSKICCSFRDNFDQKTVINFENGSLSINQTWVPDQNMVIEQKKGNEISKIDFKNNENIYSHQIKNISNQILDKKKIPKFPSMTIEEIEINTKILNSWINLK